MSLIRLKKSFGIVQIKKRHVITLGQEVRKELNLDEGDILDVSIEEGKIILEPKKLIPADQQWFWTQEWQTGEQEAQAEIDAGRIKSFDSMEDFLEDLRKNDDED
ncbi:AbrB family transcriptional regulator [Desulfosporosinus sp. Tol-M]|nr:AbrB family transcriptional regulator [Desulfosporosinus sp. Tol-M]